MATPTVAGWIAYAAERGTTVADDAASAAALVRGSDYVRIRYLMHTGIAADDDRAEEAVYIAAGLELATPGFWTTTFTESDTKVLTGLGELKWTVVDKSITTGIETMMPTSPAIEALLRGLNRSNAYLGVIG